MSQAMVGVIGGSGLYTMANLRDPQEARIETPFGAPSGAVVTGRIADVPVAFLARHGRDHRLTPSEVPYRANIYALKQLGVRYLISLSAVGSLREDFAPLDMALPDQFIDLTKRRESSYFGAGAVAHVSMADPVCSGVSAALALAHVAAGLARTVTLHHKATYVCIEGPQFSTRAETAWYRSMHADVIGMTNMPEAKLAREAQIAYATLAMVTDYDCWHPRETHVTASGAIANLAKNVERAQAIVVEAVKILGTEQPPSLAHQALSTGLATPLDRMDPAARERLRPLLA